MSAAADYLREKLLEVCLEDIKADIDLAIKLCYFDNKRSERYLDEALLASTKQYVRGYNEMWKTHDAFSNSLLKILPMLEAIKEPKALIAKAYPYLEKALDNDALICGYTIALRDNDSAKGHLGRSLEGLKYFSENSGEDYEVFLDPYKFLSFETTLLCEVLGIFIEMKRKGWIQRNLIKEPKFKDFSEKYCYGLDSAAFGGLREYLGFFDFAKDELKLIVERKRAYDRNIENALGLVRGSLNFQEKQEFDILFSNLQQLLYFDFFEEPRRRYSVENGLGDYFLRKAVTQALYEIGLVDTQNPMKLPQESIYSISGELISDL